MAGLRPGHPRLSWSQDVDARHRRQVYAVCARQTAKAGHDGKHTFATSRRDAPEALLDLPPKEGVGNAGCPWHPRPRVHLVVVERTRVTTSTPESPDVPARNGFTAYFVLSPAIGLFCHRRLAD